MTMMMLSSSIPVSSLLLLLFTTTPLLHSTLAWAPPQLASKPTSTTQSTSALLTQQQQGRPSFLRIQWHNSNHASGVVLQVASQSVSSDGQNTVVSAAAVADDDGENVEDDDDSFVPYQGEQPKEALSEIFIPHVLPTNVPEEQLWVPQTDTVSFRPLCFCVSSGYYVNLLRVRGAGVLSRHRHPGPVHGHVLKGSWKYLEHDWTATEGSYVFEPPGEIHTLIVPEGVEEMITMFHVTGSLLYCDPHGNVVGAEDVFTKLEKAKEHYESIGLGADFVQQFVR